MSPGRVRHYKEDRRPTQTRGDSAQVGAFRPLRVSDLAKLDQDKLKRPTTHQPGDSNRATDPQPGGDPARNTPTDPTHRKGRLCADPVAIRRTRVAFFRAASKGASKNARHSSTIVAGFPNISRQRSKHSNPDASTPNA